MLQEEPPLCDPLWDALFAAGVSWLAHRMGIHAPSWTRKNCRRLRFPYWGAKDPRSDYAEYERDRAPAEFFNRNIYIGPEIMYRARMPMERIQRPLAWELALAKKLQKTRFNKIHQKPPTSKVENESE